MIRWACTPHGAKNHATTEDPLPRAAHVGEGTDDFGVGVSRRALCGVEVYDEDLPPEFQRAIPLSPRPLRVTDRCRRCSSLAGDARGTVPPSTGGSHP